VIDRRDCLVFRRSQEAADIKEPSSL